MKLRHLLPLLALPLLAACSRTNISATGNAPAHYTHVYLTVTQVKFNTSATAGPADSGWTTFTLATPQTIDLVALTNGGLSQFASQLALGAGAYTQMLLVLAGTADTLTASAVAVGTATNNEVDYYDADGVLRQAPLHVPNVAAGISVSIALGIAGSSSSSGDSTSATVTSAVVDFDATRDVRPLSLSGTAAFALDPHLAGYDTANAGTIAGYVDLSGVDALNVRGVPDVQVAAETLNGDGSRHIVARTTLVAADGSFSLYPLSTASGDPTTYDIVIHGPAIDTVIIKSVPVASGDPGAATVELGTIPLTAATAFPVNVSSSQPISPQSASVGFYQTLPLSDEVPYLVEQRATDPFSGVFTQVQQLSAGSLQYATFSTAGSAVTVSTGKPLEGAGTYRIAALHPSYATGAFGTTVKASGSTGTTVPFTATALDQADGATADSISGTLNVGSPRSYDKGELLLTHGGSLVVAASLDNYLSQSSTALTFATTVPGGGDSSYADGVYYAEVWAWNSANPAGTLTRIPYGSPIDMSAGSVSGLVFTAP